MMELIREFNQAHDQLRAEADKLDEERGLTSKYYTAMTPQEQKRFDDLATQAYQKRIQAAVYKQCADRVTAHFTTNA